jgi:hypothetical protein
MNIAGVTPHSFLEYHFAQNRKRMVFPNPGVKIIEFEPATLQS